MNQSLERSESGLGIGLSLMKRLVDDGQEAIEAANGFRPDLIFMEIGMPLLNGYDACRQIREQPWGRDTVIVALTGWGQAEDKRKAHEAGFNFHLVKPVDAMAIQKILSGSFASNLKRDWKR